MTSVTPKVESFESSANARGMGSIDMRDLVALKQQLETIGRAIPSSGMYPHVEGAGTAAAQQPPAGIVEDISSVMQKLSLIISQIIGAVSKVSDAIHEPTQAQVQSTVPSTTQTTPIAPSATQTQVPALVQLMQTPTSAPAPAPVATPRDASYSRDLSAIMGKKPLPAAPVAPEPIAAPEQSALVVATQEVTAASAPTPKSSRAKKHKDADRLHADRRADDEPRSDRVFTDDEIRRAHGALDAIFVTHGHDFRDVENVTDLLIANDDELYCITRFRNMLSERHGSDTKKFMRRFDKLCRKR